MIKGQKRISSNKIMIPAWAAAAIALTLSGGCFVEFDVTREDTFSCTSDADCVPPFLCKLAEGQTVGVCAEDNAPVSFCQDSDGDMFGEGCAPGPDCNDNDPRVYPGAPELCDGKDNDCDCERDSEGKLVACDISQVDEPVSCSDDSECDAVSDPKDDNGYVCVKPDGEEMGTCKFRCLLQVGVCAGSTTRCTTTDNGDGTFTGDVLTCAAPLDDGTVPYGENYLAGQEKDEACDDLDNNCNGIVDNLADEDSQCVCRPEPCGTSLGICTQGRRLCDENGMLTEACVDEETGEAVVVPQAEVCDGLDNDCDGVIDGSTDDEGNCTTGSENNCEHTVCPGACPVNMVRVTNPNAPPSMSSWCIDAYEASRPDATAEDAGTSTAVTPAVSAAGVLPWTGLRPEDASRACRSANKRLCLVTEVPFSCGGDAMTRFPYGDTYSDGDCNGADSGEGDLAATGSFSGCTSTHDGNTIYDLSGNVLEMVEDKTSNISFIKLFGGSYLSNEANLACDSPLNDYASSAADLGFRCCWP